MLIPKSLYSRENNRIKNTINILKFNKILPVNQLKEQNQKSKYK